jgi:tetratricopeptide (TPR) repeat protein
LNPHNWGCTSAIYADYLLLMGRRAEALADIRRCLEANPLSFFVDAAFGGRLLRARENAEGVRLLQKAVVAEPSLPLAHQYLWYAHHQQQRFDEALRAAQRFFQLKGLGEVADALTQGAEEGGYAMAMRRGADHLAAIAQGRFVQATVVAGLYAFAGDKKRALDWLDRAYQQQDSWLTFLQDDLRFLSLHNEPRFQDLLRRMNIPTT